LDLNYQLKNPLRYGENAHQQAAFYQPPGAPSDSIALCTQHQGKELSYNNIADSDTALECVKLFEEPACVIVKHANPCGVAMAANPLIAYDKAYACDPTSAFGGIIAFNSVVDETLMQHLLNQQFVEVLIAPSFTPDALLIAEQKPNCRVLQYYPCANPNNNPNTQLEIKSIYGGLLVQTSDHSDQLAKYEVVTTHSPSPAQLQDLKFSWRIVKYVKSNAIVFAKNGQTLGIGSGQMSRIFSTEIAAIKAQHENLSLQGAVLASDAFFPFPDNIEKAHALGITAIIQPGGSMRDQAVIDKANELGISMIFTGVRCFRH
jgi:phosphoribosylaminoimidazolecarboxamide formyltransferase/IMP cyclohydrolase